MRTRRASRRFLQSSDDDESDTGANTVAMDEEEQEQLIAQFRANADEQEQFFKVAFMALMIFPTPLYIALPYCRLNSVLSLLSLTSIALSVYSFRYHQQHALQPAQPLGYFGLLLALLIAGWGYLEHWPWRMFDWMWSLPLVSALTSLLVIRWIEQSNDALNTLAKSRYKLKGA